MAKCRGCGHYIWSERAARTGRGSGCRTRLAQAVTAAMRAPEFRAWQVAKAAELIELGAIVPAGHGDVFRAVSSDASRTYYCSARGCTCPAEGTCYHQIAAVILTVADSRAVA